ncbi:MAG TPA: cadherin repeat domain-containing protein [Candidatus Aminicenantes bacterium]|nr:cadherin repeat domain-containing protein [Candidatus Aminicenantes bacterium]
MKVYGWMMVLALSFLFTACGDRAGKSARGEQTEERPAGLPSTVATMPGDASAPFRVQEIRLTPENPTIATPVDADPVCTGSMPEGIVFAYQWIVNNEVVAAATGPTLDPQHFRKKAWVSCRVVPSWPGGKGEECRSPYLRIANAEPQLQPAPSAPFEAPGKFQYQIQATDPDGDELTYQLLSPQGQGIEVDAKTGLLSWSISQERADALKGAVEIIFAVLDGDDGQAQATLRLQFSPKKAP